MNSRPCRASTFAFLALVALAPAGRTATYTVTSLIDDADIAPGDGACEIVAGGPCTLRAAIQEANADTTPDVIAFDAGLVLPGTITLSQGSLVVSQGLEITGPGALLLTVDGGGSAGIADRVLLVNPAAATALTVTLRGLTIRGGFVNAPPRSGGGVFANPDAGDVADIVLDDVTITGNEAVAGGGLPSLGGGFHLGDGSLTATNSRIEANLLSGSNNNFAGGGLYIGDGTVLLERCRITANTLPEGLGAGLRVRAGTTTIRDTTIELNRTTNANGPQAWGGGVGIGTGAGTAGTFIAERSTINGNSSDQGGAVYVVTGSATLTNCTISGNTADCHGAAFRVGDAGTLTLNNCTMTGNAVVLNRPGCFGNGGGIFGEAGLVTLSNTIVAGNTGFISGTPGTPNDLGTDTNRLLSNFVSAGWNVLGILDPAQSPFATAGTDQSGVPGAPLDAMLQAALTDNGGLTLTQGPLGGSPALDQGSPNPAGARPDCQTDDQRMAVRPLDGDNDGIALCDVGAVEGCVGPGDADGDNMGDECDNCRFVVNFVQADGDADAAGDACDNCPTLPNSLQDDSDGDLRGDLCDNCPRDANAIHVVPTDCNADGDALDTGESAGEQCDLDLDGIGDICDCFPDDATNPQLNPVGNLGMTKLLPSSARIDWATIPNSLGYNVYRGFTPRNVKFLDGLSTLQCFGGGDVRTTTVTDGLRRPEGLFFYVVSSFCIGAESSLGYTFYGDDRWPAPFVRPACPEPVRDRDGDGVQDAEDVCPLLANLAQLDTDGDFRGDGCESCPLIFDPVGDDQDGDGTSDACDCDVDGDGVDNRGPAATGVACAPAVPDNCRNIVNVTQDDFDGDGVGDPCDNCPSAANTDQFNRDLDRCGDACDAEPAIYDAGCP